MFGKCRNVIVIVVFSNEVCFSIYTNMCILVFNIYICMTYFFTIMCVTSLIWDNIVTLYV